MTAILMLLTTILQTEPAAEKSGLFEYKRPAGWSVVETPGGGRAHQAPDGSGALVRFLLPEPWTGSAESYHEALHTALRQGAPLRSGGKPAPFGGFLRSEAVMGAEGAPAVRMTLYTAKIGDQHQGVFYAGAGDAVFEKHLAAADALVKAILIPQARERAPGFEFSLPQGWKRMDDPAQGTTTLHPADVAPATCALMALKPAQGANTEEQAHRLMWAQLASKVPSDKAATDSQGGLFRSTRVSFKTNDQDAWLVLYTAKQGGVLQWLIFAGPDALYQKHVAAADALVTGITFPQGFTPPLTAAPAPAGAKGPRTLPAADRDVKLLGLWLNGTTKLQYGMDFGGGYSTRVRSTLYVLALWENGIAYRGVHDAPIFTDNGMMNVPEGLAVVDAAALAAQAKFEDTRFGRWTEKAGGVDIPDNWHGALKLTRDGDGFVAPDSGKWVRLAPVDGLKLDGTYVGAATVAAPEMRLTFRKDGAFETVNLVHAFGGPTNNPAFPLQGRGTYEFRKWSLVLRFEGGFTQTIRFHTTGEGLADAKALVIAGAQFVRR